MTYVRHLVAISFAGALIATGISPREAAAQEHRVAVLKIEGARTAKIRKSLEELVANEHAVVSHRSYKKTARRLRAKKLNPSQVARVADKLRLDGILSGTIVAWKGRYKLMLRLHEGTTGRTIKRLTVRLNRPQLTSTMEERIGDWLLSAIEELGDIEASNDDDGIDDADRDEPSADDEDEDEEEDRRARVRKKKKANKKAKRSKKTSKKRWRRTSKRSKPRKSARTLVADTEDEDEDEQDDDDNEESEATEVDEDEDDEADNEEDDDDIDSAIDRESSLLRSSRDRAVSLASGVSVVKRSLTFSNRADMMNAPPGYDGPTAPGVALNGELYPGVLLDKGGVAARLGVGITVDHVLSLKTSVGEGDMASSLATTQQRLGFDVRYRHHFGSKATHPSLVASVGYNHMTFKINKNAAMVNTEVDIPNTRYRYVNPGLALRVPVSPRVAVNAQGRFLLVLSTGEVQNADQYGGAKVTGFDAGGSIDISLAKHWMIHLLGNYTAIGYDFLGEGDLTKNRDGDESSIDVGGALDRYISGALAIGYVY